MDCRRNPDDTGTENDCVLCHLTLLSACSLYCRAVLRHRRYRAL